MPDNYEHDEHHDGGIFIKQDSVISFCEPTPPSPSSMKGNKSSSLLAVNSNVVDLKRSVSYGNLENTAEARVLVLYTGGTIGMIRNNKNGNVVDLKFKARNDVDDF